MAADTNPIGREAALERLVAEHQTALVRMCCRYTSCVPPSP